MLLNHFHYNCCRKKNPYFYQYTKQSKTIYKLFRKRIIIMIKQDMLIFNHLLYRRTVSIHAMLTKSKYRQKREKSIIMCGSCSNESESCLFGFFCDNICRHHVQHLYSIRTYKLILLQNTHIFWEYIVYS